MKLTDLNPRWFAEEGRRGQGMTIDCPHCRSTRLAVVFANPVDGGEPVPHFGAERGEFMRAYNAVWNERDLTIGQNIIPPGFHWQRSGETFNALTLSPSLDFSRSGHWHGFITNGEAL